MTCDEPLHHWQYDIISSFRIRIEELVNPEAEYDCLQTTTDVESVDISLSANTSDGECVSGSANDKEELFHSSQQLQDLALTKKNAKSFCMDSPVFRAAMWRLQASVRSEAIQAARQTTIDCVFK